MHALIVHCHPDAQSFNAALKDIAVEQLREQGYTVTVSDLYADGFDPVERAGHFTHRADPERFSALTEQRHAYEHDSLPDDVQREIQRIEEADLIVLQFPLWWHAQPAMLKGWFDRVFVYGGLYTGGMRYNRGRFRGKTVLCSVTTGAPESTFSRHGRSGYIAHLMWPIHCSLYYLGLSVLPPQMSYGVQGGGVRYRDNASFNALLDGHKQDWIQRLHRLDEESPITFTGWEDWNPQGELKAAHPMTWRL